MPKHPARIVGIEVGPHVQLLSSQQWFGPHGSCSVCGARPVPRAVRYWDCDDGWRSGVLCRDCLVEASNRGPRKSDYAYNPAANRQKAMIIDEVFSWGDLDGACTDMEDMV